MVDTCTTNPIYSSLLVCSDCRHIAGKCNTSIAPNLPFSSCSMMFLFPIDCVWSLRYRRQFIIEFYGFRRPMAAHTHRQSLMFICFELLILCLCFDVKIAFPIDPISNVHLHIHCTELATHTHITYNTLSIYLAISLRVIVIFVEYDFICRCHYAVDAVVAAASCLPPFYLIRNTNCFPIFRHCVRREKEKERKRWIDRNRICQHTIITSDRRWHSNRSIHRIILMQNTHQHTNT